MSTEDGAARAVVFAYHAVGARCLRVLLAHGVDVALVVTHEDAPGENIWFERVADVARSSGLAVIAPPDPNAPGVVARIAALRPDFIFSFYYRAMLGPELLAIPRRGAYNMHGSLLPKYRGRAPVNWAVLHGERETGATLHAMTVKPDAGAIVAQQAVPILPDDTAKDVFDKVTEAAGVALDRVLPQLVAGTAPHRPNDLAAGSYFGGRKPADGAIDFAAGAGAIHNLVRAVAPPYPGAFCTVGGRTVRVLRTARLDHAPLPGALQPGLHVAHGRIFARGGDGAWLEVTAAELEGEPLDAARLAPLLD